MRLKSLEIKGFKSFANDTLIHFNEKVTGIVGPNGSGKSNIIDAIRWVLGEQKTTELRLDSMSSVIFNGTKKRKPSSVARVAITFDNDKGLLPVEFQSLTISRTLYRSGNSEYRINDVVCRLKDISLLLMETGIGSDTYAIIALGMVDDILSDRDQARRRMMEQAAGVVKFKNRKRETLQKLKSTREDLNRVEDLLAEIEDNLKSLEKQAKRTAKYFELKSEYKELSLQISSVKHQQLSKDKAELLQRIQREIDGYTGKEALLRKDEAHLESMKSQLLDNEMELSGQQKSLATFIQELRAKENEKQMLLQRSEMLGKSLTENETNFVQSADQIQISKVKIESLAGRVAEQVTVCSKLELKLNDSEQVLNEKRSAFAELKSGLSEIVQKQKNLERTVFSLEKDIAVKSNLLEKNKRDVQEDLAFSQNVDQQIRHIEMVYVSQQKTVDDQKKLIESLEQDETKRTAQLLEVNDAIKETNAGLDRIKRDIASTQHEYDLTKSMVDNLEGFPESIRFLSKQKNWMQHSVLFSDILYCEDDYRIAIENYLEPWLNHFIVPDIHSALEGIGFLSNAQKGKANFILLSAYHNNPEIETQMLDSYHRAIDLVKCDTMYEALIKHFLKGVYISKTDADNLSVLSEELEHSDITIIDKRGGLHFNRRNVSGGSVGLFEGKKIGRRKNLEVLENRIKLYKSDLFEKEKSLALLENNRKQLEQGDKNKQLQQERKILSTAEYELAQTIAKRDALLDKKKQTEQKSKITLNQIDQLQQEIEAAIHQMASAQDELKALSKSVEEQNNVSQEWSEDLNATSQAFNQLKIQTIQQSNLLDNLKRELSYLNEQLDRYQAERSKSSSQIEILQKELETNRAKVLGLDEEIVHIIEVKQKSEKDLGEKEQAFFKAKMDIQKHEQQIRGVNHELLQQQNLINQLKEKSNDYKFGINALEERIQIEFQTSLKEYLIENLEDKVDETLIPELEVKVDRIKSRLANFGEINPLAVEAYNEILVRFNQITEQRDDIVEAEKSLLETIKEVEHTARTKFMEAFEQVRLYFVEVFRSLFTEEDFCDIFLEDPDDPLESPIQIIARPKGKKPQTLQQLSGGEKTLTATALLFSFYLLKPAPFCIFDEVDAPLDDANIEKFNQIIQKFSDKSQFIVVTHNKGTMASVDVIYGMYMEEQGVSGLSPVDFRKFQHSGLLETVGE